MAAGIVGALAGTFTDSFWYSAVEGEVYAMSSFFTAIVFWSILKWENVADEPGADKWLVFIFFLIGLSIGVHLLCLLVYSGDCDGILFQKKKFIQLCFDTQIFYLDVLIGGILGVLLAFIGAQSDADPDKNIPDGWHCCSAS